MTELNKIYPFLEKKLLKEIKKLPVMEIDEGMEIASPGMHADKIPLGLEGSVRVFGRDEHGNEANLYEIKPGVACIVSFSAATLQKDVPTFAKAKEKSKVILVPAKLSEKWFIKYPSWRKFILELYDERLRDLVEQHKNVVSQKEKIEAQNHQIVESINYAKYIQKAVLPDENQMRNFLADYFIYYQPKAIVSGDFYWTKKEEDKIFFCAADATGHGVPGAFMSMLGISIMNEISNDFNGNAADFLNIMRQKIKQSLKQSQVKNSPKDGFDLQLCIFYPKTGKMDFAGGNNNLIIARNNDLIEIKADRMPVGIYFREKDSFTNHTINVEHDDVFYLFSDGYRDQFGEEKNQKFSMKRFKKLLLDIHKKNFEDQNKILQEKFNEWKGDNEQIDDVLVMGIKIKKE